MDILPDNRQIVDLYTNKTVLFLINYFGITNLNPLIIELRDEIPGICIILDNVQALFEMKKPQKVNYSFTSLRKWLPVPDGAIVRTNEIGMESPKEKNIFSQWKFAGALLKNYRYFSEVEDEIYLELFNRGEIFLGKSYSYKCSDISLSILNTLNYDHIKKIRLDNAEFLVNSLKHIDLSILPCQTKLINSEMVPMFVPICSNKREQIKEKLSNNNIFCPIHWPPPPAELVNSIYEKELSLVVDQRYSIQDMDLVVSIIKSCIV